MTKYRKKLVTVNAEPFKLGMEDGFGDFIASMGDGIRGVRKVRRPFIVTSDGERAVNVDEHMIVTEENGRRYPVEMKIFNDMYEKIDEHRDSHEIIDSQREEILNLEDTIKAMKSEIEHALYSNKTEKVKRHYLENAVRYADEVIHVD